MPLAFPEKRPIFLGVIVPGGGVDEPAATEMGRAVLGDLTLPADGTLVEPVTQADTTASPPSGFLFGRLRVGGSGELDSVIGDSAAVLGPLFVLLGGEEQRPASRRRRPRRRLTRRGADVEGRRVQAELHR